MENKNQNTKNNNGIGHGQGIDLQKGNVSLKKTDIVSCYSVGYGLGHGRCFFKQAENVYNPNEDDSDNEEQEQAEK